MDMETTNTKIVKSSEISEERERNQFAIRVKVKNVCSYGIKQQCKEEQETIEKAWVKSSKKVAMKHQSNKACIQQWRKIKGVVWLVDTQFD